MEKTIESNLGSSETAPNETNYLKNKLELINQAVGHKIENTLLNDEEREELNRKLEAINALAVYSASTEKGTLDKVYEQLRLLHESLEAYKKEVKGKTQEIADFFQQQIILYFSDLHERRIPDGEHDVKL